MRKIFLDDIREPHWIYDDVSENEWEVVRDYNQFKKWLDDNKVLPDVISFDHDLGMGHTGHDCAKLIGNMIVDKVQNGENVKMFRYHVHSSNPVGKMNIVSYLRNLEEYIDSMK